MANKIEVKKAWALSSFRLADSYTDFLLSRRVMQCTPATMKFYRFTLQRFLTWIESQEVYLPQHVTVKLIRMYLAEFCDRTPPLKDTYIHAHARAIRTLVRFWFDEQYITQPIKFAMPKLAKRRLPVLSAAEVQTIVSVCNVRDKAVMLFMVDTGLRKAEAIALDWRDIDMNNGLVTVRRGKGGKSRSAVIGVTGRRALIAYRRELGKIPDTAALFQTDDGHRLSIDGFGHIFERLSAKTGIKFSAHALRRTFAILSLRSGMSPLHLQALMGHESMSMTMLYCQMLDDDLLQGHSEHSPADNLSRLAKK